jgi:hypothetical protein
MYNLRGCKNFLGAVPNASGGAKYFWEVRTPPLTLSENLCLFIFKLLCQQIHKMGCFLSHFKHLQFVLYQKQNSQLSPRVYI